MAADLILIVFRETLEAALFVGVVAAATTHLAHRGRWLLLGITGGLAGSLLMAACAQAIAGWFEGIGQDILSAALLSVALAFLAWHAIDAPRHAVQASQRGRRIGADAMANGRSMLALTAAVGLAVLREGAETVLFLAGAAGGRGVPPQDVIASAAAGLALGTATGWLVYRGLGLVRPRRLFALTHALILLLAGSLASQLMLTLSQANWVTVLPEKAWDISRLLPNDSPMGSLLHGLFGYDASPTQAQLLAYGLTVLAMAAAPLAASPAARPAHNPR